MSNVEKLIGTWLQVSIDTVSADGTRRPLYGENPKGIVIYTSDGYFSLMQARRSSQTAIRPALESNSR